MTFLAESLPVAFIPEELRVTTVGNDVINDRRLGVPSFLEALLTKWVCCKEDTPCLVPAEMHEPDEVKAYTEFIAAICQMSVFCQVKIPFLGF